MNLLFRLRQDEEGFESIGNSKLFFETTLYQRDKKHFYHTKRMHQISKGEIIYFAYNSYIIATAIFEDEIFYNPSRYKNTRYIYGHKLSNIQIINSDIRLDAKVFSTRIAYIKTLQQQKILDAILCNQIDNYQDEVEDDYFEGERQSVYVNRYERNRKAREECIKYFGATCYICGFDFGKVFGGFAKDVIHVHHKIPLSEIGEKYRLKPKEDLIPVCPNCHTAIHLKNAPDIEELKQYFKRKVKNVRNKIL